MPVSDLFIGTISTEGKEIDFVDTLDVARRNRVVLPELVLQCVDGRNGEFVGAKFPGGTLGLAVSDALGARRAYDGSFEGTLSKTITFFDEYGIKAGDHRADTHGAEGASGCGAADKMGASVNLIFQEASHEGVKKVTRAVFKQLNIEFDEDTYEKVVANAKDLAIQNIIPNGQAQVDMLETQGGRVEMLEGNHEEVMLVLNTKEGTTIDRNAVNKELAGNQVFALDVWFVARAAEIHSQTKEDEVLNLHAMVAYSSAVVIALTDGTLPIEKV